jgi:adenine deaminase
VGPNGFLTFTGTYRRTITSGLPVIPSLRLTDKGLVDVHQFKIIDVRAA